MEGEHNEAGEACQGCNVKCVLLKKWLKHLQMLFIKVKFILHDCHRSLFLHIKGTVHIISHVCIYKLLDIQLFCYLMTFQFSTEVNCSIAVNACLSMLSGSPRALIYS